MQRMYDNNVQLFDIYAYTGILRKACQMRASCLYNSRPASQEISIGNTSHWRLTTGSFVKNSRFTNGVTERN